MHRNGIRARVGGHVASLRAWRLIYAVGHESERGGVQRRTGGER